jgi:hypothetical protein
MSAAHLASSPNASFFRTCLSDGSADDRSPPLPRRTAAPIPPAGLCLSPKLLRLLPLPLTLLSTLSGLLGACARETGERLLQSPSASAASTATGRCAGRGAWGPEGPAGAVG